MNCREIETKLDLYAEGELETAEQVEIEKHLPACPACQRKLAYLQQMTTLLQWLPVDKPAPHLVGRIVAAVGAQAAPVRAPRWAPRTITVSLGLAFSAFLLLWLGYETLMALQQAGVVHLLSLILSEPEVLSRYPVEVMYAIVESLPLFGLMLTLGACLIVFLLLEQLLSTLAQRPQWSLNGNHF